MSSKGNDRAVRDWPGLTTAAEVRHFGTMLFDQQMWCWGRDVARAGGNALCAYGFIRRPPPENVPSSCGYHFDNPTGEWVALWGWGLLYGDRAHGGLFLRRYDFAPVWLDVLELPDGVWGPESLPASYGPAGAKAKACLLHLVPAALCWVAGYERWVRDVLGLEYREECVAQWHKPKVPAADMPLAWEALAERVVSVCLDGCAGND